MQLETAHIPCGGCESTSVSELLNRVQEFVACDKALCRKETAECFDDFSCAEIHGECHHRRFALKVTRYNEKQVLKVFLIQVRDFSK